MLKFMYLGTIERLREYEVNSLQEDVKHLNIVGLKNLERTLVCKTELATGAADIDDHDDDVFSDQAVDLSPVNRHPPTRILSGSYDLANRRMASLSKISQALLRGASSETPSQYHSRSDSQSSQDRFLNRIKKPKPLTNLPRVGESDFPHSSSSIYLKPKTPRTPLLVSPDCHALEERFRNLIESNAADTEKLRNLSVSSADFNFELGGSLPNTPLRTPRSFNFPPSSLASASTSGTLDLSIKKIDSDSESDGAGKIPTINIIKPEPEDPQDEGASPPAYFLSQQQQQSHRGNHLNSRQNNCKSFGVTPTFCI